MREIQFRGKDLKTGEWRYGDLEIGRKTKIVRIHTYHEDGEYCQQYIVDENTVGQFTGLKDKNGKEIYEGDIVDVTVFDCFGNDDQYKAKVDYCGTEFIGYVDDDTAWNFYWLHQQDDEIEVIGNVFDNPELIKKEE